MNPKVQMVIGIVLGVVLLIEGSSLFTAPSGPSPTRGYQKNRSSDEDSH